MGMNMGAKRLLTENQVAHLRWLYEKEGWNLSRLEKEFGFGIPYLKRLMAYMTYNKVMPKNSSDWIVTWSEVPPPKKIVVKKKRESIWSVAPKTADTIDVKKLDDRLFQIQAAKKKYHMTKKTALARLRKMGYLI